MMDRNESLNFNDAAIFLNRPSSMGGLRIMQKQDVASFSNRSLTMNDLAEMNE